MCRGCYIVKRVYRIEVDCANCAMKMEDAVKKVEGVNDASISFMMQKMTVDFKDGADVNCVMADVVKTCKKIERHFEIH